MKYNYGILSFPHGQTYRIPESIIPGGYYLEQNTCGCAMGHVDIDFLLEIDFYLRIKSCQVQHTRRNSLIAIK